MKITHFVINLNDMIVLVSGVIGRLKVKNDWLVITVSKVGGAQKSNGQALKKK